jgi:hypothetical protein
MGIYECRDCDTEKFYPRRYMYHFGPHCRCPYCGTFRVTRLKAPDKIDRVHTGFLNFLEKQFGGRLHHCRFCRMQFYDRRILTSEDITGTTQEGPEPTSPKDQADSDA